VVSDKKSRELSSISLSVVLVTSRDIVLAIIGCDSACFSPAYIFTRWARGLPKPTGETILSIIKNFCMRVLYVQRDEKMSKQVNG
jgi:hypothetical protein